MPDHALEMLADLPSAARMVVPDDLPALITGRATVLGAEKVTVYLVDHEQYDLVPVPIGGASQEALAIDATLAGRCFRQLEVQDVDDGAQCWVPVLDGMERLGVMHLEFPRTGPRAGHDRLLQFAAMVADLLMVKDVYGDLLSRVRRRRPMSLAAEIAWNLLPPLTFGTERVVISCVLAPAYDLGGDSFDYAVDSTTARFAVFDAMGHGLNAGWLATVAVAAYRNARHLGPADLAKTVRLVDAAVADAFAGEQFVTAVLAELDLATGRLSWHSAGHPAPLLLRSTRVVKILDSEPGVPLGLGASLGGPVRPQEEMLEPGDRLLLYTDGVVEARDEDGVFFGVDHLVDLVARQAAAGQPAPETMRGLMHAILEHQAGRLQDDATTMLVEWRTGGQERIIP